MKKTVILLVFLLFCFYAKASHISGADLTYRWIGGNDWEITFTFYRDCSGVDAELAAMIHFTSISCGQNFTASLPRIPGTGQEITPACPTQPTTCTTGTLYGIQEYVYKGTVTLMPCNDWVIYYCTCCRNPPIQTITSPTSDGMFIMATLNNTAAATQGGNPNSSPTFSNKPNTIICVNQQFCYNHGAIDIDGDSLVYSLIAPYDQGPAPYSSNCAIGGGGVAVSYTAPWSATQPLTSNPPVSLDPVTGDICMLPTLQLVTVMAVLVKEYRNGILVGSVLRDMQVKVITCTNILPTLPGIDTAATAYNPNDTIYTWQMCLGESLNFNIYAHDQNAGQNLTMTWNNGIPAASWSVTGNVTPNAVGHFSWTPVFSDVSNIPHCFTVQVSDNACPYYGSQTFSYCITVKGLFANIGSDSLLCKGEAYTIHAHADSTAVNWHWNVNGTPVTPTNDSTFTFNSANYAAGSYIVTLVVDEGSSLICPGADHIHILVVQTPDPHLGNDTILCTGQNLTLDAGPGQHYLWSPLMQTTQTINVSSAGQYIVLVDGGNNTRCKNSDTINVNMKPMPYVDLGPHDTCVTTGIILDAGSTGLNYTYLWSPTGATTQTISANNTGNYSVTVTSWPNSPCFDKDTIHVTVIPDPIFNLGPDTTICSHQTITLTGPTNAPYTYLWLPEGSTTSSITTNSAGTHILQVKGCKIVSDTLDLTIRLCELTVPNVITPNGDGANDLFAVKNLEYYPNSKLTIFNRWGNKVYETSNYQNNWGGDKQNDGVYFYTLIVNNNTPAGIEYHGTITVIGSKQ
jgi:gliding motility-associated-like protein